jgi:LysR family hydrogen peroxide-inducible transcriptional activator
MIQRLEEELDVKVFDRTKHPVEPTEIGKQIIAQARLSLKTLSRIKDIVSSEHITVAGTFRLGVIPTIASYLVPQLLAKQNEKFPQLEFIIRETTTAVLIEQLANGSLDGGVLAGPVGNENFSEIPFYYEKFYAYVSPQDVMYQEKEIDLDKIDIRNLWLLENEHCLRGQIERLCKMKKGVGKSAVRFESGSIDTLLHIIDVNKGITIIPEMHAMGLSEEKQDNLRTFKNTTAVREVCLIASKDYVRKAMLMSIREIIENSVPKSMRNPDLKKFVVAL